METDTVPREAIKVSDDSRLALCLRESAAMHRHLCPRQVLGVRMGLLAGGLLGLELPQRHRKRLHVFMETDGCGADGVGVATGCWIGRRTMRVVDYGKMAATFVDRRTGTAFRILPHRLSRERALAARPEVNDRWHAMLEAYQVLPDDLLMTTQRVRLVRDLESIISRPDTRVNCESCGEEVINEREVQVDGRTLCRACTGEAYYEVLDEG